METTEPVDTKEALRRKISEGMKRAHARRKKAGASEQKKAPVTQRGNGLLGRLKAMREDLNKMIQTLEAL